MPLNKETIADKLGNAKSNPEKHAFFFKYLIDKVYIHWIN